MKLDRNTNRGGRGKYALVNMRKMIPLLDKQEEEQIDGNVDQYAPGDVAIIDAFDLLVEHGIITLGNETPGDQFFVMKYKDKFTADGLRGYAAAVFKEVNAAADRSVMQPTNTPEAKLHGKAARELMEYYEQMLSEANAAEKVGSRIPD